MDDARHAEAIEAVGCRLAFLPPYSPELNPDESVWGHIKYHHVGKKIIKDALH